jgi:hypothetical protein
MLDAGPGYTFFNSNEKEIGYRSQENVTSCPSSSYCVFVYDAIIKSLAQFASNPPPAHCYFFAS